MSEETVEVSGTGSVKTIDPFDLQEDGLEWLELDSIPPIIYNPLLDSPINQGEVNPVEEIIALMSDTDYLHFACRYILNVELLPFQLVIIDMLWRKRLPMLIGSRGMGKSFILSVYALLRMVFHPGCKIVICGAAFRQARQIFDYMAQIWEKAPVLRDISGTGKTIGPRREIDRCQFQIGDSHCYAIPLGDGTKIRGLRANYILADEFASIPEEIFNLVVQGFGVVAANPVDKVKDAAMVKRLKKVGAWSEELERLRREKIGGNQIVYSGTAYYAFNHFAKYFEKWHKIIASKGDAKDIFSDFEGIPEGFDWKDYSILRVPYTQVPEGVLDLGIVAQAKATLHRSQFLMEYGACFASDSDGFYKRSVIESATTNRPILTPEGTMVQFSAMRAGNKDKVYAIGVDPAADMDNAAIVVLELGVDHRKIVYCWTTNKKKYNSLKKEYHKMGIEVGNDYYRYIARKIRGLMRIFNVEHIIMDKHGGGTAIAEALASKDTCEGSEHPVYQIIDPDEPKPDDAETGLHILQLLVPSQEINSEANHGMKKDLEDRILLFPRFDTIEIEKAIVMDKVNNIKFDTYEELVDEMEQLKTEMTTIVVTPSATLGKETFDVPRIKTNSSPKGHLRKDRYSALLYANYYARNKGKDEAMKIDYKPTGGSITDLTVTVAKSSAMYYGPGALKFAQSKWNHSPNSGFILHRK